MKPTPPPYPTKGVSLRELRGGHVEIIAWVHDIARDRGGICLTLRDASGVRSFKVPDGTALGEVTRESLIRIKGFLSGDELRINGCEALVRGPKELPVNLSKPPEDPKSFARYSYLLIRSPKYADVLRIQQWIVHYTREFLYNEGFVELLAPMISPCSDPGLRGARKLLTKLYGSDYELMSSVIMFKQAAAASFERVFFVARNVREEPPENIRTGRHLCEFTQIDVEWALKGMFDVMRLCERMIIYVMSKLMESHGDIVRRYNPDIKVPEAPFEVISYDEAVEKLKALGISTPKGKELTQEGERRLSELYDEPIWIVEYPKTSRGFYYMEEPRRAGYNRDFNLILPRGYGEVVDGGEREYRYEKIVERIKEMGEDPSRYGWFLELAKMGIPPSAGFGLGVERFTKYVLGLKYIWEAVPFPKVPGITMSP